MNSAKKAALVLASAGLAAAGAAGSAMADSSAEGAAVGSPVSSRATWPRSRFTFRSTSAATP